MRRLIILIFIVSAIKTYAQTPEQIAEVDRISYEQFQQKDFKKLKETVKDALANNIDFYYLRLRIGILAYDKKNFEYAITNFKKALEFAPLDTLSKEYLYYAYVFTSRQEMANEFASKQDIQFQQKVGYNRKPFDFIGIDGGALITDNITANKDKSFKGNTNPGKAERNLNGNLYFGELFFQNTIKNRLHINNSFSVFNTISRYEFELAKPNFETIKNSKTFNNLNFQYNLGFSYVTKREWAIAFGLGYYRVKSNTFSAGQPDILNNTVPVITNTTAINSFLGSVTISKRIKNVQPYLQISASNLNAVTQAQAEFGLTYFPLGNYNLYGTITAAYLRNGNSNQYIFKQQIGFKLLKWWWSELNFNYGNLSNYHANNGFITYNTSDAIKLQTGIDFNFYIKNHVQLNIGYTFQQRTRITTTYQGIQNQPSNISIQSSNYFTHLIKSGLIWKF